MEQGRCMVRGSPENTHFLPRLPVLTEKMGLDFPLSVGKQV